MKKHDNLFNEILKREPTYIGSYYHLGKLLERIGDNAKALRVYKRGMEVAEAASDHHSYRELQAAYEDPEDIVDLKSSVHNFFKIEINKICSFTVNTFQKLNMSFLKEFIENIQKQNLFQKKDHLLLAVSGGIDSVVCVNYATRQVLILK